MKLRYLWLTLLLPMLTGCPELGQHWDDQQQTLYVDYYKVPCDKDDSGLCFRIREHESDAWMLSPAPLVGFSGYEWGKRYTISVITSFDSNGGQASYEFEAVKSSVTMASGNNSFALTLYSSSGILVPLSDSEWQIGGDISFACASDCAAIETAVNAAQVLQLEFSVTANVITLSTLICATSEENFSSVCTGQSIVDWYVAPVRSDCGLADEQMCLLYRVNPSDNYELLPLAQGIEDFTPVWGYQHRINVLRTLSAAGAITAAVWQSADSLPDDRSGSVYSYKIILRGSGLTENSNGSFAAYDDTPDLDCSQYSLCSALGNYVDDEQWLLLQVYMDGDLVVRSIVCHDNSLADFRACVDDDNDVNWNI